MASQSMKDYLKRYAADGSDTKTKKTKKKKEKKTHSNGVMVFDEDPIWKINKEEEEEDDELEDKPIIVEDIEDARRKRLEAIRSKKPYHAISEDGSGWVAVSNPSVADMDLSPRRRRCRLDSHSLDQNEDFSNGTVPSHVEHSHESPKSDVSPQRRRRVGSVGDLSPHSRGDSDAAEDSSPKRGRKGFRGNVGSRERSHVKSAHGAETRESTLSSNLSPRKTQVYSSEISSPPKRDDSTKDISPPRRRRRDSPESISPRRRRRDSPEHISPPRRKQRDSPEGISPPRRRRRDSADGISPPRRRRRDSPEGISPPRRRRRDSPEHISSPRRRRDSSEDNSCPRIMQRESQEDTSPPRRRRNCSTDDASPPYRNQQRSFDTFQHHKSNVNDPSPPRKGRKDAIAAKDVKRSGLFSKQEIKEELDMKKKKELSIFAAIDPSISGRGAEPVFRDKEGGKPISKGDLLKLQEKPKEKKLEWGKGLAQKREAEARAVELELEKDKPFSRSRDDPELDKLLRERIRWGDPMAHLVKNNQADPVLEDFGGDEKMRESGFIIPQTIPAHSWIKRGLDFPPNRYEIRPGRHWDGVDRSNGYEKELFKRQNEKRATETEAYLWSVSEM